jgi:hypothetical protein
MQARFAQEYDTIFTHQKKQDYMKHFSRQTGSTKNRHCPFLHSLQARLLAHQAPKTALRSGLQATPYIPVPKGRDFTASSDNLLDCFPFSLRTTQISPHKFLYVLHKK